MPESQHRWEKACGSKDCRAEPKGSKFMNSLCEMPIVERCEGDYRPVSCNGRTGLFTEIGFALYEKKR